MRDSNKKSMSKRSAVRDRNPTGATRTHRPTWVMRQRASPTTADGDGEGQRDSLTVASPQERAATELKPCHQPATPTHRVFKRSHGISSEDLAELNRRFPDWTFNFGNGAHHDHPIGATERAICEMLALEMIEQTHGNVRVTDIGGSAIRHLKNGRAHVHSCNPILSSNDVVRRSDYPPEANYCNRVSLVCSHPVDVYLSVHSLYYLTRGEILEHLRKSSEHVLYAVVHRFEDLYGSMHSNGTRAESFYQTFVEGDALRVCMKVNGNLTSYTHDPCLWLSQTFYRGEDGYAMCWNGRKVGDSWILKFMLVAPSIASGLQVDCDIPMSLVSSLNRNDHYGPVTGVLSLQDEAKFKPMLSQLKINLREIKSFGPFMWLGMPTTKTVLIPKDLVESVALRMVGLPRDKTTLKLCINYMRQAIKEDKISMPVSMRTDCMIYGTPLAFVLFVRQEIESFNRICSPKYIRLYKKLSNALSLEYWASCFCCKVDTDEISTVQAYNRDRSSVPGPTFDATRAWPNGLPGYESNRPLRQMRTQVTLKSSGRDEAEPKPQFYAVAFTFSNYIPVVPVSSVNNETVAIVNRALMEVPKPEPRVWAAISRYAMKRYVLRFKAIDDNDQDGLFEEWNSRFPTARRRNQKLAYDSLEETPLSHRDYLRKSFCKRELTMKGGPEPEDFDPRAIQGNSDRLNAAYGPFTYQVSKQLKELWHSKHKITYTGGLTAEEIGDWRAQFGSRDVLLIECDESRYDCHQGKECNDLYRMIEDRCGIKYHQNAAKGRESMRKITGYTSHGVKYGVNYTMTSGSPTTSTSNSFVNGVKTAYILECLLGYKNFKLIVHGDDSLTALVGVFSDEQKANIRRVIEETNKALGFETKVKLSTQWHEVEYCSSLFWPVTGGYVLGPKVGKRLPKIGFSLNRLTREEVKGMLIGLQIECGYVPVLRTYARHALELMASVTAAEYVDRRRIYKSLPNTQHESCADTELFFYQRYGLTVADSEEELTRVLTQNLTDCVDYKYLLEFANKDL